MVLLSHPMIFKKCQHAPSIFSNVSSTKTPCCARRLSVYKMSPSWMAILIFSGLGPKSPRRQTSLAFVTYFFVHYYEFESSNYNYIVSLIVFVKMFSWSRKPATRNASTSRISQSWRRVLKISNAARARRFVTTSNTIHSLQSRSETAWTSRMLAPSTALETSRFRINVRQHYSFNSTVSQNFRSLFTIINNENNFTGRIIYFSST